MYRAVHVCNGDRNVLADYLCDTKSFPHAIPTALPWSQRAPLHIQQITSLQPDLCALEEVDHYDDWFRPELTKHGYDSVFIKKIEGNDGCALFWKTSRWRLVAEKRANYIDQNQVYILAKFEPAAPMYGTSPLFVVVTHLKAKPPFAEKREKQGLELLMELTSFIIQQGYHYTNVLMYRERVRQ